MKKLLSLSLVAFFWACLTSSALAEKIVVIKLAQDQIKTLVAGSTAAVTVTPTASQLEAAKVELKVKALKTWKVDPKHIKDGQVTMQLSDNGDLVSISQDPDIFHPKTER